MKKRPLALIVLVPAAVVLAVSAWPVADFTESVQGIAMSAKPASSLAQIEGLGERPALVQVPEGTAAEREAVARIAAEHEAVAGIAVESEEIQLLQERLRIERADHERTLKSLLSSNLIAHRMLDAAKRDLECIEDNGKTYYGAFQQTEAGMQAKDRGALIGTMNWLLRFPVYLTEAEAAWFVERESDGGWNDDEGNCGNCEELVIEYLGAARLARELSPERVAALRERWANKNKPWVFP